MNTPSPLVPQGTKTPTRKIQSLLQSHDDPDGSMSSIIGMLLQGCKAHQQGRTQTKDPALTQTSGDTTTPSNSVATTDSTIPPVNTTAMSNTAVSTMPPSQPVAAQPMPAPVATSPSMAVPASAPTGDGKDYVIAKGDTLGAIARRNSISFKTLMDANPGVNPRKLKIGHEVQILTGVAHGAAIRDCQRLPTRLRRPLMQPLTARPTLSNPATPWARLPGRMAPITRKSWL